MASPANGRNKKILLVAGAVFILAVVGATVDIMRRTSPPGSRKQLPARILNH